MKILCSFYWDCGRQGDVEGLFVTTKEALQSAYGKRVHFGEILGKHNEIYGDLAEKDITILSEDQEKIEWLQSLGDVGKTGDLNTISGYNPLQFLDEDV